jgi:hypothetical protein
MFNILTEYLTEVELAYRHRHDQAAPWEDFTDIQERRIPEHSIEVNQQTQFILIRMGNWVLQHRPFHIHLN